MKKSFIFIGLIFLLAGVFYAGTIAAQKKFKSKIAAPKKYQWSGEWSVSSRYYPSTLTIKMLSVNKFEFTIEAMNGANMGEVSGVANITGNKAYFDDRQSTEKDSDKYGCRLTFIHKSSLIEVAQNEKCTSYAGLGVVFANDYLKGKPALKEQNFVQRGVFPNSTLDAQFKVLVGQDYEKFLDAFHQIYEESDSDNLNAKVFSACVRGICPWNAAIIMYDQKGNIWAAVIGVDDAEKSFVNYYSNVSGWTEKLPKTIENWIESKREMNENLAIFYKNKN